MSPVTVSEFEAERDALDCRACDGRGQVREEDDGGSYGVECASCDGHGRHAQCSSCNDAATRRARATVDYIHFDELACDHFECIGTAVLTCEQRVAKFRADIAVRAKEIAAEMQREACAACDAPIVMCMCVKAVAHG